jgi:hypothetical protein
MLHPKQRDDLPIDRSGAELPLHTPTDATSSFADGSGVEQS